MSNLNLRVFYLFFSISFLIDWLFGDIYSVQLQGAVDEFSLLKQRINLLIATV